MTTSKLPARPSLESLRKQAKKLARDIAAGDADAIARARAQLPQAELPLSQRDAQLVLAREYGFPGWKDLVKEVKQRLGRGLEWAVSEARRIIHDNDIEGLRQLLAEYPALLSWRADENDGGLLGMATGSFGDSGDPFREEHFTRKACAELLLDAGAVVAPSVCDGLIAFPRKGVDRSLPPQRPSSPIAQVLCRARRRRWRSRVSGYECRRSCRGERSVHVCVPSPARDRSGAAVGSGHHARRRVGKADRWRAGTFRIYPVLHREQARRPRTPIQVGPWQAFVKQQVERAMHDGDLTSFVDGLRREAWMLSDACVKFQVGLIEAAAVAERSRRLSLPLFLISIPLCCTVACRRHRRPLNSRSRMRRPICFRCCCASGRCPTICHTQPGTGTSHA